MNCPYRKIKNIVKKDDKTTIITEDFDYCLYSSCPFYASGYQMGDLIYQEKCNKARKELGLKI